MVKPEPARRRACARRYGSGRDRHEPTRSTTRCKKLIDLDQRVHVMATGAARGAAPAARPGRPPRARRAGPLQPQELRRGGDDPARRRREVPEHARARRRADPARRIAVPGARLLLGARTTSQEAVAKNTGSKQEQQALQRLVEISLRTGDFDNVDGYLSAAPEPARRN